MDLDQIDLGVSPYLAMKLYHMTLNQLLTSVFFGGCIIDIIISFQANPAKDEKLLQQNDPYLSASFSGKYVINLSLWSTPELMIK